MSDAQLAFDFQDVSNRVSARGIRVRTARSVDALFEDFLDRLQRDPLPPYEQEVVLLPHGSALRPWLQQHLAGHLGCAASLYTPTIREYGDALVRRLLSADPSALDRTALTWRIFAVLNDLPGADAEFAPLRTYLDRSRGEAMPLARRLAELFDSYQTYRPKLLARWAEGDAAAGPERWQARLWREIANDSANRSRLMEQLLNRLCLEKPEDLPQRISIFGEALVPPMYLDFTQVLSRQTEVTWYAVVPSGARRAHPLKDALGEDARQAAALRGKHLRGARTVPLPEQDRPPANALAVLQQDIHAGRRRERADRISLAADDASIRIHDCHSPIRELEVLRDQLLDAFESLDDLQPSDVLVVVPDLDTYASLVEAVFSAGDESQRLPCVVARDPREEGRRYLTAFLTLLETLDSRLTAGSVLELLSEPAIGRTAHLDSDALEVVRGWIRATHIRWGADGEHRRAFGLPEDDLHTWRYGIDRLLMGLVAGATNHPVDGVLPYAEATLDRAPILGRFVAWMQALTESSRAARQTRSVDSWRRWLEVLIQRFMSVETDDEQMAEDHLLGELREMTQHAPDTTMNFASLRSYLSDALSRFEGRGRLFSGGITVADFERLRFVPARVIACVGLNDDAFPRRSATAEFDLIGADCQDGDPDPRRLDKQLFLDMLLTARDRLILTYNGRSQKDNSERAPSVAIDAQLEACTQTFTMGETEPGQDAKRVREHFVIRHPLQPFSPQYFDGSDPRLFSYDHTNCIPPPQKLTSIAAFAPEVLSPAKPEDETISLRDLISAWSNPSKFFCQQLGIDLDLDDLSVEDLEPHYLDGLERYRISDRILELLLDGESEERVQERLRMEGSLPAGALGRILYRERRTALEPLHEEVERYGERQSVDIDLEIGGRRLIGRIRYVTDQATFFFRPASKIKPKDRVEAWISHLAMAASGREKPTKLICMNERQAIERVVDPLQYLEPLVRRYADILREPVPLFPKSSMTFSAKGTLDSAVRAYDGNAYSRGDCADVYVALLNRHHQPIVDRREDFEREARAFWQPIDTYLTDA